MDSLEDMEMDEPPTPMPTVAQPAQQQPQPFTSPNIGLTSLDTPLANTINAQQAFRQSAPTTPATTQPFTLFNNPTVSSVNTPALSSQSIQQTQNRATPDSSLPGTPGEIDSNFMQNYDMFMAANNGQMMPDDFNLGSGIGFGLSNFDDMTIDEPAKRLFSKQNTLNQQQLQYAMKNGQIPMDSEFAKRMREQQLVSGVGGPVIGFPEPEVKPFKCPVIGCEKAYKNQNGLKYHKQVCFTLQDVFDINGNLTSFSMAIKTRNSKRTTTALSLSSIQSPPSHTQEPWVWRKRNRIAAKSVANGTRTSMA